MWNKPRYRLIKIKFHVQKWTTAQGSAGELNMYLPVYQIYNIVCIFHHHSHSNTTEKQTWQ